MMRALWRDGVVYMAGSLLSRGIALLLLPLLTRVLSPPDFGALDLIVTCGVLVNLVVPLEISQALARLWNERDEGAPRRRLAGTAWTFTLAGHALFVVVAVLAAAPIAQALLGDPRFAGAVRAGACMIALNAAFYLAQNQFRWALRPRAYAVVSVGYAAANLAFVAVAAWGLDAGLERVLWAQAAAAAVAALAGFVSLRDSLSPSIVRDELAAMLRFSLPLVPAAVAVFASFYLNRFLLGTLATLEDVGVFGIASRLATLVTLVLVGVQGALTPLVYAHHRDPQTPPQLARLLEVVSALALTACLALGLFGNELIAVFATPAYAAAAPLLCWLAAAALLAQMYIFTPGIAISKKTGLQLLVTLASALASLVLNALLIPRWGALGATLATLAAGAVYFGGWLVFGQRVYPLPLRRTPLSIAVIVFIVVGLAIPLIDGLSSSGTRWLTKSSVLFSFVALLVGLGLIQPRRWRRDPATAH